MELYGALEGLTLCGDESREAFAWPNPAVLISFADEEQSTAGGDQAEGKDAGELANGALPGST